MPMNGKRKTMSYLKFNLENWKRKFFHPLHHRNFEIDYVLDKLTDLSWLINITPLNVLDVGCNESLLLYELEKRKYRPIGFDLKPYYVKLPKTAGYFMGDFTNPDLDKALKHHLNGLLINFVVALSSIEHIGLGAYGDSIKSNGDRLAVENIHKVLDDDGYFIMTIPQKYWQSNSGRGYTPKEFYQLIDGLFKVFHSDLRGGQICSTLVKV